MQKLEGDGGIVLDGADLASSNSKSIIRVLHVDDDSTFLEISKLILMDMGNFEIDHARCVDEAFKKLATGQYAAIISDYEMPQKDGLQFLKELREQGNEIPFILFTGKGREEIIIKALNFGSDAYINKQGNPETVYGELSHSIVKTIERKNSKKLLADSESKYLRLFNAAEVGMFRTKLQNSEILECNEKLLQILGYTREEMQGKPATFFYADPEQRQELIKILQAKGQLVDSEIKLVSKNGEVKTCLLSSKVYPEGDILEGSIIDITERKKAEDALALSEMTFRAYLEGCPLAVFAVNFDGKYEYVNDAAVKMLGYAREELLNMTTRQVVPKNDSHGSFRLNELKEKGHFAGVLKLKQKNGTIIDVSLNSCKFPDGKLVAFCEDITETKKAKEALMESEANYRNLINGMNETAWVIDFNGNFVEINDAAAKTLGYSKDELLTMGIKDIDKALNKEQFENHLKTMPPVGTKVFERTHVAKDGTEIPVEISSSLITYHGKRAKLSVARDITERKKAERALAESEERYKNLFENAPDVIVTFDLTGK